VFIVEIGAELQKNYYILERIQSQCQHFVLVCWCVECPLNCNSCTYSDTAEATMCWDCDYEYAVRLSDGQCYGKYFVSYGSTSTVEPAKLAFEHQNNVVKPSASQIMFLEDKVHILIFFSKMAG